MAGYPSLEMMYEQDDRDYKQTAEEDDEEIKKTLECYYKNIHKEDRGSDESGPYYLYDDEEEYFDEIKDPRQAQDAAAAAAAAVNKVLEEIIQSPASKKICDVHHLDQQILTKVLGNLKDSIAQETLNQLTNRLQGEDGKHVDAGGVDLGSQAEAGGVIMDIVEGVGSTKDDINANDSVDIPTSKTLGKRPNESGDYADIVEGVGSTKDDINANDSVDIPTSKTLGKRPNESGDYADGGALSATNKIQKLARMEKLD